MASVEQPQPTEQVIPVPLSDILRAKLEGRLDPGQPPFTAADYLAQELSILESEFATIRNPLLARIWGRENAEGKPMTPDEEKNYMVAEIAKLEVLTTGLKSHDKQAVASIRTMLEAEIMKEKDKTAADRKKFGSLETDTIYEKIRRALEKQISEVKKIEVSLQATGGDLNDCPSVVSAITDKFTISLDDLRSDYRNTTTVTGKLEGSLIRSDQRIARFEQAIASLPSGPMSAP